jgi:hypothetical protein
MRAPLKYDDIVNVLVERIPAFVESDLGREVLAGDRDLPYVVFGGFASFLNQLLLIVPPTDSAVQASFQLLNEMAGSADQRVLDLAGVGVFEILTDSSRSIQAARELLYGPGIDLFERMIQLWGVDVKDP